MADGGDSEAEVPREAGGRARTSAGGEISLIERRRQLYDLFTAREVLDGQTMERSNVPFTGLAAFRQNIIRFGGLSVYLDRVENARTEDKMNELITTFGGLAKASQYEQDPLKLRKMVLKYGAATAEMVKKARNEKIPLGVIFEEIAKEVNADVIDDAGAAKEERRSDLLYEALFDLELRISAAYWKILFQAIDHVAWTKLFKDFVDGQTMKRKNVPINVVSQQRLDEVTVGQLASLEKFRKAAIAALGIRLNDPKIAQKLREQAEMVSPISAVPKFKNWGKVEILKAYMPKSKWVGANLDGETQREDARRELVHSAEITKYVDDHDNVRYTKAKAQGEAYIPLTAIIDSAFDYDESRTDMLKEWFTNSTRYYREPAKQGREILDEALNAAAKPSDKAFNATSNENTEEEFERLGKTDDMSVQLLEDQGKNEAARALEVLETKYKKTKSLAQREELKPKLRSAYARFAINKGKKSWKDLVKYLQTRSKNVDDNLQILAEAYFTDQFDPGLSLIDGKITEGSATHPELKTIPAYRQLVQLAREYKKLEETETVGGEWKALQMELPEYKNDQGEKIPELDDQGRLGFRDGDTMRTLHLPGANIDIETGQYRNVAGGLDTSKISDYIENLRNWAAQYCPALLPQIADYPYLITKAELDELDPDFKIGITGLIRYYALNDSGTWLGPPQSGKVDTNEADAEEEDFGDFTIGMLPSYTDALPYNNRVVHYVQPNYHAAYENLMYGLRDSSDLGAFLAAWEADEHLAVASAQANQWRAQANGLYGEVYYALFRAELKDIYMEKARNVAQSVTRRIRETARACAENYAKLMQPARTYVCASVDKIYRIKIVDGVDGIAVGANAKIGATELFVHSVGTDYIVLSDGGNDYGYLPNVRAGVTIVIEPPGPRQIKKVHVACFTYPLREYVAEYGLHYLEFGSEHPAEREDTRTADLAESETVASTIDRVAEELGKLDNLNGQPVAMSDATHDHERELQTAVEALRGNETERATVILNGDAHRELINELRDAYAQDKNRAASDRIPLETRPSTFLGRPIVPTYTDRVTTPTGGRSCDLAGLLRRSIEIQSLTDAKRRNEQAMEGATDERKRQLQQEYSQTGNAEKLTVLNKQQDACDELGRRAQAGENLGRRAQDYLDTATYEYEEIVDLEEVDVVYTPPAHVDNLEEILRTEWNVPDAVVVKDAFTTLRGDTLVTITIAAAHHLRPGDTVSLTKFSPIDGSDFEAADVVGTYTVNSVNNNTITIRLSKVETGPGGTRSGGITVQKADQLSKALDTYFIDYLRADVGGSPPTQHGWRALALIRSFISAEHIRPTTRVTSDWHKLGWWRNARCNQTSLRCAGNRTISELHPTELLRAIDMLVAQRAPSQADIADMECVVKFSHALRVLELALMSREHWVTNLDVTSWTQTRLVFVRGLQHEIIEHIATTGGWKEYHRKIFNKKFKFKPDEWPQDILQIINPIFRPQILCALPTRSRVPNIDERWKFEVIADVKAYSLELLS